MRMSTELTKFPMKDFIVKLRKSAGLSQEELAQKLGFSRPTLVAMEKGERDITLTELRKISEILIFRLRLYLMKSLEHHKKLICKILVKRLSVSFIILFCSA